MKIIKHIIGGVYGMTIAMFWFISVFPNEPLSNIPYAAGIYSLWHIKISLAYGYRFLLITTIAVILELIIYLIFLRDADIL